MSKNTSLNTSLIGFHASGKIKRRLRRLAQRQNRTLSAQVRLIIEESLSKADGKGAQ